MILISKVEIMVVQENVFQLDHYQNKGVAVDINGKPDMMGSLDIIREHGKAQRFINTALGLDVWIGASKEVQDLLQMPIDAIGWLQSDISSLRDNIFTLETNISVYQSKLNNINSYGFWKRLKCLFSGVA